MLILVYSSFSFDRLLISFYLSIFVCLFLAIFLFWFAYACLSTLLFWFVCSPYHLFLYIPVRFFYLFFYLHIPVNPFFSILICLFLFWCKGKRVPGRSCNPTQVAWHYRRLLRIWTLGIFLSYMLVMPTPALRRTLIPNERKFDKFNITSLLLSRSLPNPFDLWMKLILRLIGKSMA